MSGDVIVVRIYLHETEQGGGTTLQQEILTLLQAGIGCRGARHVVEIWTLPSTPLEQFQQKCVAVLRPELRKTRRVSVSPIQ